MAAVLRRALGAPELGLPPGPLLLRGERGSGKTALLLAAALRAAAEEGHGALFIARRPLQRLPGGARDPLSLQKIQFVYPRSTEELVELIATVHENRKSYPSLIVLDGLDDYLSDHSGQQMAAQLLALLVDTAAYFTDKLCATSKSSNDSACSCQLIVSMRFPGEDGEETEGAQDLSVIERYFPERCWLEPDVYRAEWGEQADGVERCYWARFSSRQESEVGIDPSTRAKEWRLCVGSDGAIKLYTAPIAKLHPNRGQKGSGHILDAAMSAKEEKRNFL